MALKKIARMPKKTKPHEALRIRKIEVLGLFRRYNHRIDLRLEDRITILHGRNGVGKTVTLRLIHAFVTADYYAFARTPFGELKVEFSSGTWFKITPSERSKVADAQTRLGETTRKIARKRAPGSVRYLTVEYELAPTELVDATTKPRGLYVVEVDPDAVERTLHNRDIYWVRHVAPDVWIDERLERTMTTEEVVTFYELAVEMNTQLKDDDILRSLTSRMESHLIEAQRLFKIAPGKEIAAGAYMRSPRPLPLVTATVREIALDLAARIKEANSKYTETSLKLDGSLPKRLFQVRPAVPSDEELLTGAEYLDLERNRLQNLGLLNHPTDFFDPKKLDLSQKGMFSVYLKDNRTKLDVFKDLADRTEILLQILSKKLRPKSIRLDMEAGYRIYSHDNRELNLEALSSGEQHELVLLHNLLFRVPANSLVLIDEPEISLHVTWQREFLGDLGQMAKRAGFDAIVATHSPYIVGPRRDLLVQLGEPENVE